MRRPNLLSWITVAAWLGAALLAPAGAVAKPVTKPAKAKAPTPASVPAPTPDVKSWTLPNGLQVLFLADHKAPIVTVQVFYHVGSRTSTSASAASRTCSST